MWGEHLIEFLLAWIKMQEWRVTDAKGISLSTILQYACYRCERIFQEHLDIRIRRKNDIDNIVLIPYFRLSEVILCEIRRLSPVFMPADTVKNKIKMPCTKSSN